MNKYPKSSTEKASPVAHKVTISCLVVYVMNKGLTQKVEIVSSVP
jgi:hypothetical protein